MISKGTRYNTTNEIDATPHESSVGDPKTSQHY